MTALMTCVLLLGIFEVVSNAYHLTRGSVGAIGQSAKRQHQELPLDLTEGHFVVKAVVMLVFGVLLLAAGALYFGGRDPGHRAGLIVFAMFAAYGLTQATVYRRAVNVWPAAVVYSIPLLVLLLLR